MLRSLTLASPHQLGLTASSVGPQRGPQRPTQEQQQSRLEWLSTEVQEQGRVPTRWRRREQQQQRGSLASPSTLASAAAAAAGAAAASAATTTEA